MHVSGFVPTDNPHIIIAMSDNPGPPKSPISGERSAAASSDLDEQSRLQLAHELCMNENLEMSMPDPNSIVGHVKQIVHRSEVYKFEVLQS